MSDEQDEPQGQTRTAWHPLLVLVIEHLAPPELKIMCEFLLNRLPLRVDIVVVQVQGVPATPARKLKSIFEPMRKHTLIEFKGVRDALERGDVTTLLAYAGQYMTMHDLYDPEDILLMVLADRMSSSFVNQIERMGGTFVEAGDGIWNGRLAGLPLHGVALRDACKSRSSEGLLYMFTEGFLKDPGAIDLLDDEDATLYDLIVQQVEQFRRHRATMALKDVDLAEKSFEEVLAKLIERASPEQRLKGLAPEQRLEGLAPEQRLKGLAPEQRLEGLAPEQRLEGLTSNELRVMLKALTQKLQTQS